jgi:Cu2+-exporting ATPase
MKTAQHSTHREHDHAHMNATSHHQHGGKNQHSGHDKHSGHSPAMFKRRFFVCLVLTLPILYLSPMFQMWFGYQAIQFPGVNWITPILATIIYFYGGWMFLKGAWFEFHSKIGMMTSPKTGTSPRRQKWRTQNFRPKFKLPDSSVESI